MSSGWAMNGDEKMPIVRRALSQSWGEPVDISVVIKCYNEEEHIEECLRSIFLDLGGLSFEVIIADSCSSDRTVEIAKRFPVTIVQLADDRQRSCGAGGQLGYQLARGKFVLFLDGDMALKTGFTRPAIALLDKEQDLAAVAGITEERSTALEYQGRSAHPETIGDQECLNGSALYRASAIRSVGYFTNRNLHCREEWELGKRLSAQGWRLKRIPLRACAHYGHTDPPLRFLRRRWATKYVYGYGELVRASLGQPYFGEAVASAWKLLFLIGWWLVSIGLMLVPDGKSLGCLLPLLLVGLAVTRKRGLRSGLYFLGSWNLHAAGMVIGLLRRQVAPTRPVPMRIIARAASDFRGSG
jgi:glycosyltransferase involved in cell wall biosynthesis